VQQKLAIEGIELTTNQAVPWGFITTFSKFENMTYYISPLSTEKMIKSNKEFIAIVY